LIVNHQDSNLGLPHQLADELRQILALVVGRNDHQRADLP